MLYHMYESLYTKFQVSSFISVGARPCQSLKEEGVTILLTHPVCSHPFLFISPMLFHYSSGLSFKTTIKSLMKDIIWIRPI